MSGRTEKGGGVSQKSKSVRMFDSDLSFSLTLHGPQQGVVVEGPLRYGGDVIAVKATAGTK